jgi:hypothetical protein
MNIGCRVTLATPECLGMRSHGIGDESAALFVQPGLALNCVQHECMRRLVSRFGRSHDPSLEVGRNFQRGRYRAGHNLLRASGVTKVTPPQSLFKWIGARRGKPVQ